MRPPHFTAGFRLATAVFVVPALALSLVKLPGSNFKYWIPSIRFLFGYRSARTSHFVEWDNLAE